jgi:small nuclear ribonucleoprotein (snRNP)-like protein
MQPFHPITEKSCKNLVGKPVLVFLTNGSEIYGIVSRVEKNKLILNDNRHANTKSSSRSTKPTPTKKGKKKQAQPVSPTQPSTEDHQLSSFSLIRFGGPLQAPAARPTGPVDIQIDYIAAMFSE